MKKFHQYITLLFFSLSIIFMEGQVDTSSYHPEVLFKLDQAVNASPSGKKLRVLSNRESEDFLFVVSNPAQSSNEIWYSAGSKETTWMIGSMGGYELNLLGKLGDDYVVCNGYQVCLINVTSKKLKKLSLKDKEQKEYHLNALYVINDHLFFSDDQDLYCTKGTQESTFKVVDGETGIGPVIYGEISEACELKEALIFKAYDKEGEERLWFCNGTPEGTNFLRVPPTEEEPEDSQYHGPAVLIGSEQRAVFSDENGYLFSTDGTDKGTFMLPYHLENREVFCFTIFQDEFYWTDRESSSVWKMDNATRMSVMVCEQDSISLGGDFTEMEGKGYWISDGYRNDAFGKKIDLSTCEVSDDCEANDCMNDFFYVIQIHDHVGVYYRQPGKNKVPFPVFESVNQDKEFDNVPHRILASLEYLDSDLYEIDAVSDQISWIVDMKKNSIRPIHFGSESFSFTNPDLYLIGDMIYFFDKSKGSSIVKAVKR